MTGITSQPATQQSETAQPVPTALVPKAVLDRAIDGVVALADNMMLIPILAVIGIATAGLALVVSFRVSCRFYLAKEL
ncbi:hypothetical protein [Bifidobacterium jacchi]|uniref:Uncharacterized protein n=1 Tax=Bifidobacterium jacchi TaxID=2490545 RepID=A0A5N5RN78_9BIFI|nr:hypothetical protein [Bifidobacterium jacchi]KAB5608754.1 hypothetical protein EHS19_00540 [Bifidobacterium jacchi]